MMLHIEQTGPTAGIRITGIVMVLIGAALAVASAASAAFDLGEDLELGRAIHDVDGGPLMAWIAAALLVAVAGVALVNANLAARLLTWAGVGAAVAAVVLAVASALTDGVADVGFGAIPFVIAFFSFPAIVTSLLFKATPPSTT